MNKTILLSGVSRGIGRALAELFLDHGYTVVGVCRTMELPIQHPNFTAFTVDLSDLVSVKSLSQQLAALNIPIDMLINNAGIGPDLGTRFPEETTWKDTFDVNVTGTAFLTEQCIPLLSNGATIINISSKMGSIEACAGSDAPAYRISKAALNMYTKILANRYAGIYKVAAVHPGWVRTTIAKGNSNGPLSPQESAAGIYNFITSDFRSGIFWDIEAKSECNW